MKKVYMYNVSRTFPRLVFVSDSFDDLEEILILAGVLNIEIEKIMYDNTYGFRALTADCLYSDCDDFIAAARPIGWRSLQEYNKTVWHLTTKVNYSMSTNDSKLYVTATKFEDLAYACQVFANNHINIARLDTTNDPEYNETVTYTLVSATIPDVDTLKRVWHDLKLE